MEILTNLVPTTLNQHRRPIFVGAGAIALLAVVLLGLWWFLPKDVSSEAMARVDETCRQPHQNIIDELEQQVPLIATDGEAFVRSLEQLPWLVAILSERSTAYEVAQATAPAVLATNAKDDALQRLDLTIELATCYEKQLRRFTKAKQQVAARLTDLRNEREALAAGDFSTFFATGEPATAVIELAPREQKRVRLRTLCIDRFAPPPQAGTPYILSGTVDEVKKPTLCGLLRSAQAGGNLAPSQNAVWQLEQHHMDESTPAVEAAEGSAGMFAAQRDGSLFVTAEATGTLTALDITLTNATDNPLSVDTSCAYFVPLSMPDLNQPIPSPPPDWSDPATVEKFTEELKAQQEQLRRKYDETREGSVQGIYSRVYIPSADNVDPDTLDRFQVVQTGIGVQPLGTVGVVRGSEPPGRREIARVRDILERQANDPVRARERLEGALDDFAHNPSRENAQNLFDALQSCIVNSCAPSSEMIRIWEQIRTQADRMVDQAVDRLIVSITEQTLHDAVDAIRFCQTVGCHVEADVEKLDTHLRGVLRDRQRGNVTE